MKKKLSQETSFFYVFFSDIPTIHARVKLADNIANSNVKNQIINTGPKCVVTIYFYNTLPETQVCCTNRFFRWFLVYNRTLNNPQYHNLHHRLNRLTSFSLTTTISKKSFKFVNNCVEMSPRN